MQEANIKRSPRNKKDLFMVIFLILVWVLIVSLWKDYRKIVKGYIRVNESFERLEEAKKTNEELENRYKLVTKDEYVERMIREKLNMQKSGEVVAVLPKSENGEVDIQKESQETIPNWKKWWSLVR